MIRELIGATRPDADLGLIQQAFEVAAAWHQDRDNHVVVLLEGPAEVVALAAVPAEVRAAVTGDWVATSIRLTAQRLLSYAADGARS